VALARRSLTGALGNMRDGRAVSTDLLAHMREARQYGWVSLTAVDIGGFGSRTTRSGRSPHTRLTSQ